MQYSPNFEIKSSIFVPNVHCTGAQSWALEFQEHMRNLDKGGSQPQQCNGIALVL